jgi:transposase-like protein
MDRRVRRTWSPDEKRKIAEDVQERLRDGVPFSDICREHDILRGTLQIRQERSKPIVNGIGARAAALRVIPGTPIAKAITYLDNRNSRSVSDSRVDRPLTKPPDLWIR